MPHSATELFEGLAKATWERLRYGEELHCSQSEETITDINLLEMKRAQLYNIRVWKAARSEEAKTGLDWEWWIGSGSNGWWRYAVQAKKLHQSKRYETLSHKVRGERQIDILARYAKAHRCIPLYCLYNYTKQFDKEEHWHCCRPANPEQIGCTVASIDIMKTASEKHGGKSFDAIHRQKEVLPWRCLLTCPTLPTSLGNRSHRLAGEGYKTVQVYDDLPSFLIDRQEVTFSPSQYHEDYLRSSPGYDDNLRISPKRIMVIDTASQ